MCVLTLACSFEFMQNVNICTGGSTCGMLLLELVSRAASVAIHPLFHVEFASATIEKGEVFMRKVLRFIVANDAPLRHSVFRQPGDSLQRTISRNVRNIGCNDIPDMRLKKMLRVPM